MIYVTTEAYAYLQHAANCGVISAKILLQLIWVDSDGDFYIDELVADNYSIPASGFETVLDYFFTVIC